MVRVEKTGSNGNTPPLIERRATHVSTIGKFKDSRAGAFCISEESLDEFYKLVDNAVKYDGWKDYSISESISDLEAMPVIIDLDMKKKLPKGQLDPTKTEKENTEAHRMYKLEDIMELTQYYISYLRVYLDDLPETSQAVYILEKEHPTIERNTQPRGQLGIHDGEAVTLGGNGNDPPCKLINGSYYEIKDGVHIIMPNIVVKRGLQLHIRQKMLENERVKEILNGFQSSESIENIFDKNTIVSAPWPMYGARKQKYKLPYLLTVCYQLKRITEDVTSPRVQLVEGENYVDFTNTVRHKASQDEGYLIKLLSVRNKSSQGYGGYPIKAEFVQQLNNVLKDASGRARRDAAAARLPRSAVTKKDPTELRNIIKYVTCLGSKRATTRSTWLQVGWCLYNLHNADSTLLNVWISFSKKSENPRHVSECEEVCPKEWEAMRLDKLGMGSLKLWAQEDNPGLYETICRDDIYHQLLYGKSFKRATAVDFAKIVYSMYKDHHICINVLKNIWYYYHAERHIWVRDDGAAELDRKIPDEVYSRINYICEQEIGTEYRQREEESITNRLIEDVRRIGSDFAVQQYLKSINGGGAAAAPPANDQSLAILQSIPSDLLSTMSPDQIRLLFRTRVNQGQEEQSLHHLVVTERQSLDVRQQLVAAQLNRQMERLEQEVANRDYNNSNGIRNNHGQSQSRILEFKKKLDDIRETTFKSHILKECKVLFYKTDVSQNFICNLDTNTNILVCKNGVLDLLVGEIRDGRPEDFMSLSTRIEYKPLIEHDRDIIDAVDKFLESIYIVKDVRDFIKYLMSTFLTGSTKNESFAVLTGRGSNGKSKIFKLLTRALGEYAKPINVVIFTSKRPGQGQATPDFAQLKGVRLAIAEEPENNTDGTSPAINGGIIKEFTGDGAGLNVRPLYSENIVIHLQTKLLLGANHKLRVDASDEAIRRRLNNIEHMTRFLNFDTGYLEDDWMHFWRDDDLGIDLWGEVFLSMLVDEFLWRRKTPKPLIPAEIQYYSRNYFNIFDEIKMFWDECIVYTSSSKDSIDFRVLYAEYKNWFFNERDKNAKPMSIDKFTFQAKRRHPDCLTRTKKTLFNGIRIRQVGEEDVPNNQYNSDADSDNDNDNNETHKHQTKKMGKSSSRFGAKNRSMFSNDKRSVDQIYSDRFKFRETYDFDIDCVPTFIFLKYDRDRAQQTILFQGAHPLHRAVFFLPKFVQEYLASGDQYEFRFGVLIPPENEDSARVVKSWTLMPVCTQEERIETVRSHYMKQIEMFRDMMDIYVYEDPDTLCISERYKYRPDYRFSEVIPRAYDEVKNRLESKIENVLSKLHERIMSERGGFEVDYDQMHIDSEGVFADSDHMDMDTELESESQNHTSSRKRMRVFEEEEEEKGTHNGSFPKRRVVLSDSNIIDTDDLLNSIQNSYSHDEEDEE
jgi:phage/plasmid-associated DNA primase